MDLKIGVIVGTTRPNRVSRKVADWFMETMKHEKGLKFKLIDLAEVKLPMYDEPMSPLMGKYENEHTKKWSKTISKYDGYVFITAEYNYAYPASLKNAIDYLYHEWVRKPVAFVGYGTVGGARAIEQLRPVTLAVEMAPLKAALGIREQWNAFDDNNKLKDGYLIGSPEAMADNLRWWGQALKTARQQPAA